MTIIIPVYNGENRIVRCVESVLNQTYRNLNVIIVDDGSTDSTISILSGAVKDSRVRIYERKKNRGVSATRNFGIELALTECNSEWIAFLDSDDYLANDAVEKCLIGVDDSIDLIACGLRRTDICDKVVGNDCLNEVYDISPVQAYQNIMDGRIEYTSVKGTWLVRVSFTFFRTQIIRNQIIRFQEGLQYAEDALFAMRYLQYCNKIRCVSFPLYTWWERPDSLSSLMNANNASDLINEYLITAPLMMHIMKMYGNDLDSKFCSWIASFFFAFMSKSARLCLSYDEVKRLYMKFISCNDVIRFLLSCKVESNKERVAKFLIQLHCPQVIFCIIKCFPR